MILLFISSSILLKFLNKVCSKKFSTLLTKLLNKKNILDTFYDITGNVMNFLRAHSEILQSFKLINVN